MKGTLKKDKDDKWIVEYGTEEEYLAGMAGNNELWSEVTKQLPLHPDDVNIFEDLIPQLNGKSIYHLRNDKEVEFEIVDNILVNNEMIVGYYAKLITSPKQEVSEEAKRRTKNLYAPSHKKYIESKQEKSNDLSKITRFEVIDEKGRSYTNYSVKSIELSYQDDNRTLKVFIK